MKFVEVHGVRLSAIGLGCWQFGSTDWGYGKSYGDTTAVDIVHTALDLGVNLIDTAEVYARGVSEAIVGRAIEGRRDEAYIATKFLPTMPTGSRAYEHGRLSSMPRRIDLYQIHWPNPIVPLRQTMEGMRRLQDEGVATDIGVSNYSAGRWRKAEVALGRPVLSNQVQFSLVRRNPDTGVVPYAQSNDRLVIAYSPLAQGFLGGRYDGTTRPSGSARALNPLFLPENLEAGTPLINTLRGVAAAHDATPAQVALAWLLAKPNVVAIPGASSVDQLRHNVAAADLELSPDELQELTHASDRFHPKSWPQAAPAVLANMRR